jgi:hypothetical protein
MNHDLAYTMIPAECGAKGSLPRKSIKMEAQILEVFHMLGGD